MKCKKLQILGDRIRHLESNHSSVKLLPTLQHIGCCYDLNDHSNLPSTSCPIPYSGNCCSTALYADSINKEDSSIIYRLNRINFRS